MKTRAHLLPATLILIGLFGTSAPAQDPGTNGRQSATIVDVEFAGGDLAEFVEAIRGSGRNINILLPPEASEVSVPPLTLREVSVESALRAVADVTTNELASVHVSSQRRSGGQPVFTVRVLLARPDAEDPTSGQKFVRVYSISGITKHNPGANGGDPITTSAETVLTAIDTGLEVASDDTEKAQIRYHADSDLLFVRGTWSQQSLIESILENMNRDVAVRRQQARRG